MPVELIARKPKHSWPIHLVADLSKHDLPQPARAWADANGFAGEAGKALVVPGADGAVAGALFGLDPNGGMLPLGALARALPAGDWHFSGAPGKPDLATLALVLGGYVFTRYGRKPGRALRFALPPGADA